jgi:hypothetical protein
MLFFQSETGVDSALDAAMGWIYLEIANVARSR